MLPLVKSHFEIRKEKEREGITRIITVNDYCSVKIQFVLFSSYDHKKEIIWIAHPIKKIGCTQRANKISSLSFLFGSSSNMVDFFFTISKEICISWKGSALKKYISFFFSYSFFVVKLVEMKCFAFLLFLVACFAYEGCMEVPDNSSYPFTTSWSCGKSRSYCRIRKC